VSDFNTDNVYDRVEVLYVNTVAFEDYNKYISYMEDPKVRFDEYVESL